MYNCILTSCEVFQCSGLLKSCNNLRDVKVADRLMSDLVTVAPRVRRPIHQAAVGPCMVSLICSAGEDFLLVSKWQNISIVENNTIGQSESSTQYPGGPRGGNGLVWFRRTTKALAGALHVLSSRRFSVYEYSAGPGPGSLISSPATPFPASLLF